MSTTKRTTRRHVRVTSRRLRWLSAVLVALSLIWADAAVSAGTDSVAPATADPAVDDTGGDTSDSPPSPEQMIENLAKLSDEEINRQFDEAIAAFDAEQADPEAKAAADPEEQDAERTAIDGVRDPEARRELIAQMRAMTADELRKQIDADSAADPRPEEDVTPPGSLPATPGDVTPVPAVADPPTTTPMPVTTPDAEERPGKGANWNYEEKTTDKESFRRFLDDYAKWLGGQQNTKAPADRDGGPTADRWIEWYDTCSGPRQGTRQAPTTPTRPGAIYTPTTDTFASNIGAPGQSRQVWTAPGATNMGSFTTRWVGGQEQFLLESHITSSQAPFPFNFFNLAAFQPEITVSSIGKPSRHLGQYGPGLDPITPNDPNVDVLCYANDAGVFSPYRGYVRAWLPVSLLAEPGFQVRVDVVARFAPWLYYFGSDMTTVHLGKKPLAARDVVQNAIGLSVDHTVLNDENNNPNDDLEGILVPQLTDGVTRSVNATAPKFQWVGFDGGSNCDVCAGWLLIANSAITRPVRGDVSLRAATTGDDERRLGVDLNVDGARFEGSFSILGQWPCRYRHDWSADVHADVQIDPDTGNPRLIHPATPWFDKDGRNPWGNVHTQRWRLLGLSAIRPFCRIFGAFIREGMRKGIRHGLTGLTQNGPPMVDWSKYPDVYTGLFKAFNGYDPYYNQPVYGSDLDAILKNVDLTTPMQNGVVLGNGNGVSFPFDGGAGWQRTCVPRGCQGGGVAISAGGLEAGMALNATDRKPVVATRPRRFPLVYDANSSVSASQLLMDHTDKFGQPFSAGLILNNGSLNQVLRSVTEGSQGPDTTNPSLAPNGFLDAEFPVTFPAPINQTWQVRTTPTVAPGFVDVVADPANPNKWPATIALPDLRLKVNDGSGWGDPAIAAVNLGAGLDVTSVTNQTIDPSLFIGTDSHILRCHSLFTILCVPWGPAIDAASALVSQQLDAALTNITIPDLSPAFVLGNVRLQKRGAHLAIYASIYPKPVVDLSSWYAQPWYGFTAHPTFPPGPLTYNWEVRDLLKQPPPGNTNPDFNLVFRGATSSPDFVRDYWTLTRVRIKPPGLFNHSYWLRSVRAKVVVTGGGGLSATGTKDMQFVNKIW